MQTTVVIRGNLKDEKTIELDEPVHGIQGPVEVTVRQVVSSDQPPLCETLRPAEWKEMFHTWLGSHDPNLPVLPNEALRRESVYEDR